MPLHAQHRLAGSRCLNIVVLFSGLLLAVSLWASGATAADDGVFPVTVEHALGSTTIETAPQRIVTLGWNAEDIVLALGEVPIAMPRYSFFESGIFPWNEERLSGSSPVLLAGRNVDFEQVAALKPDLILATSSDIDDLTWNRLSTIAPTVAYRSGPFAADWKEQTQLVGMALGKSSAADQLIEGTRAFLGKIASENPQLRGRTFTFGTYFPGSGGVVVYLPSDPRVAALTDMGLRLSPGVEALAAANPDVPSVSVSLEQIDPIDADILIMWYGPGARAAAESQPLFNTLGAVKRGSYVALEDPVDVWSTSALSVLSIPYGFPRFVPRLVEAARRSQE
ncbi:iron-siderophore ABC transporter substrate-binding protein [Sinorhizobium sp. BG8]|uniref:iron-siderophore ABC transporter substrate-binding protein n=1 Tax=Sinorhizobium sp. BG8 TaxID=2613773 RepID=UPI00193E0883|nr:iron-siderophore ABC transporter substrate-binding protein [Sinorhizobium sp. BG8]QRM54359.1 iron-siderophore ABC transporter substrate-binding protein [Sinorhizobium sp. BG8]